MSVKRYTKEHEWVSQDNNIGTIGITNHAQESLGDIVFRDVSYCDDVAIPVVGSASGIVSRTCDVAMYVVINFRCCNMLLFKLQ